LVNFSTRSLFAYLNSFLFCAYEVFYEENERFLQLLEKKNSPITCDLFVSHLRRIRDQNEDIILAFDQLQKTFNEKLLLDVLCNLAGLCIDISWCSIWIIHPGLGLSDDPNLGLVNKVIVLVLDLLCVWIIVSKPISLFFLVSLNQLGINPCFHHTFQIRIEFDTVFVVLAYTEKGALREDHIYRTGHDRTSNFWLSFGFLHFV
jgi:hypothetical protein